MADRLVLGPFIKVYRLGQNLLLFKPDPEYIDKILEEHLKTGLKISPGKIFRAYKNGRGKLWVMVEFMRGYDFFKHFKLAPKDKYAWRIPRIVVEVCPSCGGDIVDRLCLDCGEAVDRPKYLEVWRDPEAVEELIPVDRLEESSNGLMIVSGEGGIIIDRHIWHEKIISIVRKDESVYARILVISGGSVKH